MDERNKKRFLPSNFSAEEMSTPKVEPHHVEDFKTPDQIASAGSNDDGILVGHHDPFHDQEPEQKQPLIEKVKKYYVAHKKACLIGAAIFLVVFGLSGYLFFKPEKEQLNAAPVKVAKKAPKITTVPSTLTGIQVDPAVNSRTVTGVMIENSMDARPQSGLGQAGIVFEAIAEGGITRFLALFQDSAPESIGPVRSARPYYVEWAMGFDASYAHVGGSPEALANIRAWGARDLDQFANSGAYHRISSRAAPHNVYTSIAKLNQLEAQKGFVGSTYTGFPRDLKDAPLKAPTAKTINLAISGAQYNVRYDYDATTNSYNRVLAGAPHVEANTGKQISPKVVIALVAPYSQNGKYSVYGVVGSGQAYIYQNGGVTVANWTKADRKSQINFTDSTGIPIKLAPGQTWITAIKTASNVSSTP